MALQTSGAISLNNIHVEAGGTTETQCSINDSDIRSLNEASGKTINNSTNTTIDFDDFYGASSSSGGSGPSGPSGGNNGCLVYGTLINMADGTTKAIEDVIEGDEVVSYNIDGIGTEEEWVNWYTNNLSGTLSTSTVIKNKLATYHYYFLINNLIKATWEQPFLIKGTSIQFVLTRDLRVGELIFNKDGEWIEVSSIERIDENIQTGVLDVEDVDNYFAEGFLTHNIQDELVEKDAQE
tara:strand:- start:11764 stop:12477 length:714 start_codon:yes stop_codon:yes gene_type:complete